MGEETGHKEYLENEDDVVLAAVTKGMPNPEVRAVGVVRDKDGNIKQ